MVLKFSDTQEEQDTAHNPGQADYDRKFNDIKKSEEAGTFQNIVNNYDKSADPTVENDNIKRVKDGESKGDNVDYGLYNPSGKTKQKVTGKARGWRRKGPIATLIAIFFGGAVGIGGFFGAPSLLIVNMSEVITQKLNTTVASLDVRANKIIALKMKGTTSGVCSTRVNIMCKYTSLSKDEIMGMKENGITLRDKQGNIIDPESADTPNKVRPATFEFEDGKPISATEMPKAMSTNTSLRSAMQKGFKFSANYASVSGNSWAETEKDLGISKRPPFDESDNTDDKRLKKIEDTTKNGATETSTKTVVAGEDDEACGGTCTKEQAQAINEGNAKVNGLVNDANIPDGTTALKEVEAATGGAPAALDAAANTFKATGYFDNACSVYGTIKAIGFAAKTVRYEQLARYAMVFLTTASMIRAGVAVAGDVNYLGNTLTKTTTHVDANGKTTVSKAAPDALAYRNLAWGDTGSLDTVASQFLTAAGFTGVLINITSTVENMLGGKDGAVKTCHILANPIVQIGSLAAGIGMLFIPGVGQAAFGIKEGAQIAGGAAIVAANLILPSMLKDIVAGTVINKNTYGEAAASAWISGAGATFSKNGQHSADALLTPVQAAAYNDLQNQTLAEYAEQDRMAYSPLDPTHANTFMGTLVTKISPYAANLSSFSTALSSVSSLVSSSFSSIISPNSNAAATAQNYATCPDENYKTLNEGTGVATDLFCNPIRGIPPVYLNAAPQPDALTQQLIDSGDIDPTTGEPISDRYKKIEADCIDRQTPLGDDSNGSDGSDCFINNQSTANLYIHLIDQRALYQMENGMDAVSSDNGTSTTTVAGSTIDQAQIYDDSTNVACAPGTEDAGIAQGYHSGKEINIHLCSIPNTIIPYYGKPVQVNSRVSGAFLALINKLIASPVNGGKTPLKVADSFRTYAQQQSLYKLYQSHLGNLADQPGYSNHEMGLAVDFQMPSGNSGKTCRYVGSICEKNGDPVYDFLKANAAQYGLVQLNSEYWHWQPTAAEQG